MLTTWTPSFHTTPLLSVHSLSLNHHLYTDDTQLFVSSQPTIVRFKLMVMVTEMTINGNKSSPLTVTVAVMEKFH